MEALANFQLSLIQLACEAIGYKVAMLISPLIIYPRLLVSQRNVYKDVRNGQLSPIRLRSDRTLKHIAFSLA
jgi:hypothetical protein